MSEAALNPEAVLDTELRKPQYATMSDEAAADAVMAKTSTTRKPVPASLIRLRSMAIGMYAVVKIAAENNSLPNPPRGAAINFITLADSSDMVDLDHPDVAANAETLRQFSLASEDQINAINTLGDAIVRWVDTNGIGEVGVGAVINSRRRIAGA